MPYVHRGIAQFWVGLWLSSLLSACGSFSILPPSPTTGTDSTQQTSTPAPKKPSSRKGGGYYKDDGPGEQIPDNLDRIPDAIPRWEALHKPALRPYTVLGKDYVPITRVAAFHQRGVASWYGKKFHGLKTSNGEAYDMFAMTGAHPTLPIPSYVRVTNLSNQRSVIVRINDRGPFHTGRVIDLSYTAAYKLGYLDNGSAEVEIQAVLPDSKTDPAQHDIPPPQSAPPVTHDSARNPADQEFRSGIYLQFGAFRNWENADNLRNHLMREMDWAIHPLRIASGDTWHRLQMGPFPDRKTAEDIAQRVSREFGGKPAFVSRQ